MAAWMNNLRPSRGFVLAILVLVMSASGFASDFDQKTTFKKDQPLTFPGFRVTFVGERRVMNDLIHREFRYFDFRIESGKDKQVATWSPGTGDIAPATFKIDGKSYLLEMQFSDTLGRLKSDEIVIRRAP